MLRRQKFLQSDRSRLQSQVSELVTSVQSSQDRASGLTTQLARTRTSLAKATAANDASQQQVTRLTADNGKLDANFKTTRQQLASTTKSLNSAQAALASMSDKLQASQQALKALADKTKPTTVEPDTKSQPPSEQPKYTMKSKQKFNEFFLEYQKLGPH